MSSTVWANLAGILPAHVASAFGNSHTVSPIAIFLPTASFFQVARGNVRASFEDVCLGKLCR